MNLKQLSEILGISQTTISRALNGYPEVNKETRKRVEEAARKYGYTPSAVARRLAGKKAEAVAVVLPRDFSCEPSIILSLLESLAEKLRQANIELLVLPAGDSNEIQTYERARKAALADAFVVLDLKHKDPRIDYLQECKLGAVVHGHLTTSTPTLFACDSDQRHGSKIATKKLLDLGHRHIALLNPEDRFQIASERKAGFLAAYQENLGSTQRAQVVSTGADGLASYSAARTLLCSATPPTAFISASSACAEGVCRAVEACGKKLGEDISLVAWSDGRRNLAAQGISTIDAPLIDLAEKLVQGLLALLRKQDLPSQALLKTTLSLRESLAAKA